MAKQLLRGNQQHGVRGPGHIEPCGSSVIRKTEQRTSWNPLGRRLQVLSMGLVVGLSALLLPAEGYGWGWGWYGYFSKPSTPASLTGPSVVSNPFFGAWRLNWSSGGSYATRYELWESAAGGRWGRIYSGASRSFYRSGRRAAGNYQYKVRACSAYAGCSGFSHVKTVRYLRSSANGQVSAPSTNHGGSFNVSWLSPSHYGFGSYGLEMYQPGKGWVWVSNARTASSYRVNYPKTARVGFRIRKYAYSFCFSLFRFYIFGELSWGSGRYCRSSPGSIGPARYTQIFVKPGRSGVPVTSSKSSISDGAYTVSWSAASGSVSRYVLQRRSKSLGARWFGRWRSVHSGTGRWVNQNMGDGDYQYRVYALNPAGWGPVSSTMTTRVVGPPRRTGLPTVLSKSGLSDGAFALSWRSSGRVTQYYVERRSAPYGSRAFGPWQRISASSSGYLHQSLGDGHYQYRVLARNEAGVSAPSGIRTVNVLSPPGRPGLPSYSGKSSLADTHFSVSWVAGGRVTQYQVERRYAPYGSNSFSGWSRIANTTSRSLSQSLGDGRYQYRVLARNEAGTSSWSSIRTIDVLRQPGTPSMPDYSGKSGLADNTFSVSWAATGRVTQYFVERRQAAYGSNSFGGWSRIATTAGRSLHQSLGDGRYQYRVLARNEAGSSNWSAIRTINVLHLPSAPRSVRLPASTPGAFVLQLQNGSGRVDWYQVQDSRDGGRTWRATERVQGRRSSLNLMRPAYDAHGRLDNHYRFRVAACNDAGCGSYSAPSNTIEIIPPGTPKDLTHRGLSHPQHSTDSDGGFVVSWSPINVGGIHYNVEELFNGGAWQRRGSRLTAVSLTLSNKNEGVYHYRVQACVATVGCGDWTHPMRIAVRYAPDAPVQPTVLSKFSRANASVDGAFTLHWQKPRGRVTRYELFRNGQLLADGSPILRYTFADQADGYHNYQVKACNDVVCGAFSPARQVRLLRKPVLRGSIHGPGSSGTGGVSLSWPAAQHQVTRYEISRNGGAWIPRGVRVLTYSESNLQDGVYSYRYRACNDLSCSVVSASKQVEVYRKPGAVNRLQGPTMTVDGAFTLRWSRASGSVTAYRVFERVNGGNWTAIADMGATSDKMALTKSGRGRYEYKVTACYISSNTSSNDCGEASPIKPVVVALPLALGSSPLENVNAFTLPASDAAVGATGGSHEVGADGSANYTIAIPAPAGRGGLTPQLALSYSSNGGNSELGVGWDITGLSRIHRCGQSYALDGQASGVAFSGSDQLCLDGQRLIVKRGSYGTSGARYQLLQDPQTEIRSLGDEGSLLAPDTSTADYNGFSVRGADGRTLYFGASPDSRLQVAIAQKNSSSRWGGWINLPNLNLSRTVVYQWMLSRIEDRQGNVIRFVYNNVDGRGEQRLREVRYNFNASGANPLHRLVFDWQERPDKSQAFFAGVMLSQTKRLQKVTAYSSSKALRSLHLSYSNAGTTGHSKITQIQECAGTYVSASVCLKPTVFGWQNGSISAHTKEQHLGFILNRNRTWTADINGDGYTDILAIGAGNRWSYALGSRNGLGAWRSTGIRVSDKERDYALIGDINGDGFDDVMFPSGRYWTVRNGSAAGFGATDTHWTSNIGYKWSPRLMDVNGDGLADLVHLWHEDHLYYRPNTGGKFGVQIAVAKRAFTGEEMAYALVMDANGDGLQDLLIPNGSVYVLYQSTGSGFVSKGGVFSAVDKERKPQLLDLNGDGLTDVVFRRSDDRLYAHINKGTRFAPAVTILDANGNDVDVREYDWERATIADANGDGEQELVAGRFIIANDHDAQGRASIKARFRGGYWVSHEFALQGDFNGDGALDVVRFGRGLSADPNDYIDDVGYDKPSSYSGSGYSAYNSLVSTSQITRPDYLTTITNGMGVKIRFEYKAALRDAGSDFYVPGTRSSYPLIGAGSGLVLVSAVEQDNGATPGAKAGSGTERVTYRYENWRAHAGGLGGLGFARRVVTNTTTGTRTELTYSQDYGNFTQGSLLGMRTVNRHGRMLSDTRNTWKRVPLGSGAGIAGKRYRLDLTRTEIAKFDWNGESLSFETSDYTYNSYGQPLTLGSQVYESENSGTALRRKTTTNQWSNDEGTWDIGLLTRSDVAVTTGTTLRRRSQFQYSSASGQRGRKVGEQIIDPGSQRVLVNTRYGEDGHGNSRQDAFGNLLATTVQGPDFATRTTTVAYDSAYGLHPVSSTNALGETTHHAYYGATEMGGGAYPGKLKLTTAPNGLRTKYEYDAFGRASKTISAYGTTAAVASYQRFNWCDASTCRDGATYATTAFTDGGTPVIRELDRLTWRWLEVWLSSRFAG